MLDPDNILYVIVDSLRKDHVNPDVMPYTAGLAEDGVSFESMYATAPATAASCMGLAASRYYSDVDGIGLPDDDWTTLAEAFAANGYHTIGRSSNKFTSSYYNYDRGFAEFDSPTSGLKFLIRRHLDEESRVFQALEWAYHHYLEFTASQSNHQLSWWNTPAHELNDWLEPRLGGEPWFGWVHYMDPHHPLEPPDVYLPHCVDSRGDAQSLTRDLPGRVPSTRRDDLEATHALYEAECRYWDDEFAHFHQDLPDDTLVVVVGDHGELLGEHSRYGHPHEMWQELTNVPCIIHHPDLEPRTIESLQSTIDLPPTILDAADEPVPAAMRGSPISLEDPDPREHAVGVIETPGHVGMLRTEDWTWMRHQSRRSTQDAHGDLLLPVDAAESVELGEETAGDAPGVCSRYERRFDEIVGGDASATGHRMEHEQVKQHMADLGYLDQQ